MALIEVRLRPTGPWRAGDSTGDRERTGAIYRSDSLYSAVTHAMRTLGWMDEWLDATARATGEPAARFSSLFPFQGETDLVPPPRSQWPSAGAARTPLQNAKLIPMPFARGAAFDEAEWSVDGESGAMIPAGAGAPFTFSIRSFAAVDRLTGCAEPHRAACVQFAHGAGLWGLIHIADDAWDSRVKSAFRLLADSGFGAGKSRGWGRAAAPEFRTADATLLNGAATNGNTGWWLLSLYSPHEGDAVDWSRGDYAAETRGGWVQSSAGSGRKKQARFITEGSVLSAASLRGRVVDVAPDGFDHPVYRAGLALAIPVSLEAEA